MYLSVYSAPIRSLLDLRGKNISQHKYVVQKKRMVSRVKHAKLVYFFLEGNAPSFPLRGADVWKRRSVSLQTKYFGASPEDHYFQAFKVLNS